MTDKLTYKGLAKTRPVKQGEDEPSPPYLPDKALKEAVNLAIFLKRPLLLKGEPGSGKTRLAKAVADELGLDYEFWSIKSISKARDGLYTYDAVSRLRNAQLAAVNKDTKYVDAPQKYVRLGPLGRAFANRKRTVVLIDEIDKADIDFPNDLLLELDEKWFKIEETGRKIVAKKGEEPIIFITSNDEKDLPDAFLRRCLFHYIEFPNPDRLEKIVNAHFPDSPPDLVKAAVERFQELRDAMKMEKGDAGKKVSTSELIDWFRVLRDYSEDKTLARLDGKLPYPSVLLKSWDDHRRFLQQIGSE